MIDHIARGSYSSPYLSFTRAFGIAMAYAAEGPSGYASAIDPGYVYEIELSDGTLCKAMDPVVKIAQQLGDPWRSSYQHDGGSGFLLGVIDPENMSSFLSEKCIFPEGASATPRAPNLSKELEALVRALRDAEILIHGNVPASVVRHRHRVYS